MNFSAKIDNDTPVPSSPSSTPSSPRVPGAGAGASAPPSHLLDYYSITSSFQHLIMTRQIELQNLIIKFVRKRFGVKSAAVNAVILLLVTHPTKVYEVFIKYLRIAFEYIRWLKSFFKAKSKGVSIPKPVKMEINYIHENSINHLYMAVDWYLRSQSRVVTDHDHVLGVLKDPIDASSNDPIESIQRCYPTHSTTNIVYRGCVINYIKDSEATTIYAPSGEMKKRNYKIMLTSTECSKDQLEAFCIYCANQYAKSKVNNVWKQKMYTNQGDTWREQPMSMNKRKVSTVILDDDMNTKILDSLRHFIDTEEWHLERGISYKQSYLFYGPPGTGKTSLIKALSHEIQRHIHFLNLSTVQNDDQLTKLMSSIDFKTTIVVLEDIDAMSTVTHSRHKSADATSSAESGTESESEPVTDPKSSRFSLSCLLNQLDGIRQTHGMILIMTSNHPEVLDRALIRDGRVDEKILFSYATMPQIHKMFLNFYNESAPTLDTIKTTLQSCKHLVPSTVESSMRHYYKDPHMALEHIAGRDTTNNGLDLSYLQVN